MPNISNQQLSWKNSLDAGRLSARGNPNPPLNSDAQPQTVAEDADYESEEALRALFLASAAEREQAIGKLRAVEAKLKNRLQNDSKVKMLYAIPFGAMAFKDVLDILMEFLGIGTLGAGYILDAILGFLLFGGKFYLNNLADEMEGRSLIQAKATRTGKGLLVAAVEAVPLLGFLPMQAVNAGSEVWFQQMRAIAARSKLNKIQKKIQELSRY